MCLSDTMKPNPNKPPRYILIDSNCAGCTTAGTLDEFNHIREYPEWSKSVNQARRDIYKGKHIFCLILN